MRITNGIFVFFLLFGCDSFGATDAVSICGNITAKLGPTTRTLNSMTELQDALRGTRFSSVSAQMSFFLPQETCDNLKEPALFVGRIYDSDRFYLNEAFIGSTGSLYSKRFRSAVIERVYSFPATLLRCNAINTLDFEFSRLLPGRMGPIERCFQLENYEDAYARAESNRFFRSEGVKNVGLMLLAMAPFFLILFWGDPRGRQYRRFALLLFSGAFLCFTLSGWFLTFSMSAELLFKLNTIISIFFMACLTVFITEFRAPTRSTWGYAMAIFGLFFVAATAISRIEVLETIYRITLAFFLIGVIVALLSSVLRARTSWSLSDRVVYGGTTLITGALILDVFRYFEMHNIPNLSPWALALAACAISISLAGRIKSAFEAVRDLERNNHLAALGGLASQVAHDIRSPLAALDNFLISGVPLPEEKRILVRAAINRIKDIAYTLIEKNRTLMAQPIIGNSRQLNQNMPSSEPMTIQLISSLLEPLVTEKRMQYRSRMEVDINCDLDSNSYGLFAKVQVTEFKRVLSNLINNAVEALSHRGAVTVTLTKQANNVEIRVTDNGKGIPKEIIGRLGRRGETYGKSNGSGLGLYHARDSIQRWGGALEIRSESGRGTEIVIVIPEASRPTWFVSELKLEQGSSVVVIDDDLSIHSIWQGRFDAIGIRENGIEILHFSTPTEVTKWAQGSPDLARSALFLTDYELLGHNQTGLDLITALDIGPQSILVTSRFEEGAIRENCERMKVRLIPKGLAGSVPITLSEPLERYDYVLLDDDSLCRSNWNDSKGDRKVLTLAHPDELMSLLPKLCKRSPIYIDSNLGQDIIGEIIARKVFDMGFENIWICSGYQPETFAHLSFIRGVIGKLPPWICIDL